MTSADDAFELRARELRKSFGGVEVLHGVDLLACGGRVMALLGENGAGKSTAVKIIAGDYRRDSGQVLVDGREVSIETPRDAEALGVRVIYQEFMDAPTLSVAENISLGRLPARRLGFVDWREARRRAEDILKQLGVELDVRRPVASLSVAERQVVEIARSLAAQARVMIFDEPTSALAAAEVDQLFEFIERLREQGVAIIYITHRLDEVDRLADDVTVFRDGWAVASGPIADFDRDRIVEAMVGEALQSFTRRRMPPENQRGDEHPAGLVLRGLSLARWFEDVDLTVEQGEIVSLFGRLGCGAVEVAESVYGIRPFESGTMQLDGRRIRPRSPVAARAAGIGLVPVDRKEQGIFATLNVAENLTVTSWDRLSTKGVLWPSVVTSTFQEWQQRLSIRAPGGPKQVMETLSGGNQQKVVLGRWLAREVRVLVLAEPTRGVDVGARADIYRLLEDLAAQGVAILVVSSDVEEVLRVSDRVTVMSRGRVVDRFDGEDLTQAALTNAAATRVA